MSGGWIAAHAKQLRQKQVAILWQAGEGLHRSAAAWREEVPGETCVSPGTFPVMYAAVRAYPTRRVAELEARESPLASVTTQRYWAPFRVAVIFTTSVSVLLVAKLLFTHLPLL